MTDLIEEIRFDRLENVKKLIKNGANVNQADVGGYSPLMIASINNRYEIVDELIKTGKIHINQANNEGYTALLVALINNNLKIAKSLLELKPDVNKISIFGESPLTLIANSIDENADTVEIVHKLLKLGARVNHMEANEYTPLMLASRSGHLKTVKLLLNSGAKVNLAKSNGMTALEYAIHFSDKDVIKELLKAKDIKRNYDRLRVYPKPILDLIFPEVKKIQSLFRGSLTRKETKNILREISHTPVGRSFTIFKSMEDKKLKSIRISMLRNGSKITENSKKFDILKTISGSSLLTKEEVKAKLRAKSEELVKKEKKNPKGRFSVDLTDRETKKLEKIIMRPFELVEKEIDGNVIIYN